MLQNIRLIGLTSPLKMHIRHEKHLSILIFVIYRGILLVKRCFIMEIRVLKYFLMVAREENITKAANLLHLT